MIKFLYPIVFYVILTGVYFYSTGKLNIKNKSEYEKWVATKGGKVSRAVIIIGILYTIFFLMQLMN
ncbi:hypothetical protein KZY98_09935 [Croceibacter atlanticus]|uniref:hypothetical protein n=1 Tax=Croceibacter atlanticus TaxID=313588 RepID=UPI001C5D66A9|nr:hypothetical protein [Croceibacter atlanticus]MBW4970777.1 hypothetical protein [Croceibacter atlanticus]